jgi:hypothetical protein
MNLQVLVHQLDKKYRLTSLDKSVSALQYEKLIALDIDLD